MKKIRQNIPLKDYSKYKIGGKAAYFLEVTSKEDLVDGLKEWEKISQNLPSENKKMFILSGGSNVLIDDRGFDGLIIHNDIKTIKREGNLAIVGSGVSIKDLLEFCVENCLSGLEWAGGLPGTIGGAVRGNAGAFGGEIKDSVVNVLSLSLDTLKEHKKNNLECRFGYRTSIFKKQQNKEFILTVTFQLVLGTKGKIKSEVDEKIDYRKLKHPMDTPSLGSTFKNIPIEQLTDEQKKAFESFIKNDPTSVLPVAKLLHLADLKGKRIGDAQVSEKHPNFIVNLGGATSKDVVQLINFIKERIKQRFDIALEEEIAYLPK